MTEQPFTLRDMAGVPVLVCADDGPPLADERAALDLIGDAGYQGARWVAVPAGRCGDDFFQLRTRIAGDIVQKFANYRIGLAILGDIRSRTDASTALRDFVRESNRGGQLWFLPDEDALVARLVESGP
ncbi:MULTISPECIES: DUF4180 domain-containing protein [unclassified Streptomyces]|uniref:DUF4180 domain-containing protein n=1 Tax=unclassified Streptomyces TaxID=2593676 RepID=UPI000DB9476A|nr:MULTISPECIES: DUF4180 domain-containing protein [unclassified Streptomyces]MYT72876.1 DUF4180 domain-containing protein [Streptomyces sp. SID8367]RAJ78852.1 uncharacterized protein DUF4180 [Streptomyces sp. PsTaAH-137]